MKRIAFMFALLTAFMVTGFGLPRPASATAVLYFAGQECENRAATATFRWETNSPDVVQRWLDLTTQDNGWQPGTFIGLDISAASGDRAAWGGLTSRTYHFVRMNQQLSDGSWESSETVGFETRQCGGNPITSVTPTVVGFSLGVLSDPKQATPPGGTLLRDCGETVVFAYVSFPETTTFAVVSYEWYLDGARIASPIGNQVNPRVPVLLLRLGAVPTRSNNDPIPLTIRFPNTSPPSEATIYLQCR